MFNTDITLNKDTLARQINEIGEAAFRAGYVKALKDVLECTNGKVSLEVTRMVLASVDKEQAEKFVKDHPFKFK